MQLFVLTIFWMVGILWAMYYWYLNTPTNGNNNNNVSKVVFDYNSDKRHSTSSIESLEHSDNEGTRRKHIQKLKHEIKTRWPSRTSIKPRHKSF